MKRKEEEDWADEPTSARASSDFRAGSFLRWPSVGSRSRIVCSGLCRRSGSGRFRGTAELEMQNPAEDLVGRTAGFVPSGATGRQASNAADQWWFPRQREKRPRRRVSPGVSGRAGWCGAARHLSDECSLIGRVLINPRGSEDCFRGHTAWCCTSTTLSIFLLESKGRARIQAEAGTTLAFAHGLRGTAWAKPCFCFHAEPRS